MRFHVIQTVKKNRIKFTIEFWQDIKSPFLDSSNIALTALFETSVYRKKTLEFMGL